MGASHTEASLLFGCGFHLTTGFNLEPVECLQFLTCCEFPRERLVGVTLPLIVKGTVRFDGK